MIAIGLLGLLLSMVTMMAQNGFKQQVELKNASGILKKINEIQIALAPINSACRANFTSLTWDSSLTNYLPPISSISNATPPGGIIIDTSTQFENGVSVSLIQLVDLTQLSPARYTGNILIRFTKPTGSFDPVTDKKIPVSLTTITTGTMVQIVDCTTTADTSDSEQLAFCLSSVRVDPVSGTSYKSTWNYLTSMCVVQGPIAGVCGSAAGGSTATAPTTNLCSKGNPSSVTGIGPWNWKCKGIFGGNTVSCSSSSLPVNGTCGSSSGTGAMTAPTSNFCNSGTFSGLSGGGPWSWTCIGSSGGSAASCFTNSPPINGSCGSSNGGSFSSAPSVNLCNAGNFSGISGGGPWTWSCNGLNGGSSAGCIAYLPSPINGDCGSSSSTKGGGPYTSAPTGNFCNSGNFSGLSGGGPWDWTCDGVNGGSTAVCRASFYQCQSQAAVMVRFNTFLLKWVDKPGNNTGTYLYCVNGSTLTGCSGTTLSPTQCDIPHSQCNNGNLKNGAFVECCRTVP